MYLVCVCDVFSMCIRVHILTISCYTDVGDFPGSPNNAKNQHLVFVEVKSLSKYSIKSVSCAWCHSLVCDGWYHIIPYIHIYNILLQS